MTKKIEYTEEHKERLLVQASECLQYLNYTAIHKVMVALDWTWTSTVNVYGESRVPTREEIMNKARHILIRAVDDFIELGNKDIFGGTAGFDYRIKYWKKDDKFTIDFGFYVSTWDSGYE